MSSSNRVEGYWIDATKQIPKRIAGRYGEIDLYCLLASGEIEVCEFIDFEYDMTLLQGHFDDTSVTHWLQIPSVTGCTAEDIE